VRAPALRSAAQGSAARGRQGPYRRGTLPPSPAASGADWFVRALTLRGNWDRPRYVAFAPGIRLAASADDSTVKLWNPATGQELATLGRTGNPITALRFAPDARTLLAGSEDGVQLWAVPEAR
jgi:WD40 repeat protein